MMLLDSDIKATCKEKYMFMTQKDKEQWDINFYTFTHTCFKLVSGYWSELIHVPGPLEAQVVRELLPKGLYWYAQ